MTQTNKMYTYIPIMIEKRKEKHLVQNEVRKITQ